MGDKERGNEDTPSALNVALYVYPTVYSHILGKTRSSNVIDALTKLCADKPGQLSYVFYAEAVLAGMLYQSASPGKIISRPITPGGEPSRCRVLKDSVSNDSWFILFEVVEPDGRVDYYCFHIMKEDEVNYSIHPCGFKEMSEKLKVFS